MTREEQIAAIRPKLLETLLDAFETTYAGKIEEDTQLDHGWDSLDLIELVIEIEDALDIELYDDFIDKVLPDHSTVEQYTVGGLLDLFLSQLRDDMVTALAAHIANPGTARLTIDLPTR